MAHPKFQAKPFQSSNCSATSTSRLPTPPPMSFRFVVSVLTAIAVVCSIQATNAMQGEVRIYREPYFKRLRQIIRVTAGNLCYDMPCATLSSSISSSRWTGLPTTGSSFVDGQVKIAFYAGTNCTGNVTVLNTNVGEISNFAQFGMDSATKSIAVLETSTAMLHESKDLCK